MDLKKVKKEIDNALEKVPDTLIKSGVSTLIITDDQFKAIKKSVRSNKYKGFVIEIDNTIPEGNFYIK